MSGYAERLAATIRQKRLRQKDITERLGIPKSALSKIVTGRQYLDFDLAVKLCEILGVSLDWLAYGREADSKETWFRNPERQRLEYLLSILRESEYHAVIVAIEGVIELRLATDQEQPAGKSIGV